MNIPSTSFSVKNLVMSVAALYAIGLSAFLIYNTFRITSPITQYGNVAAMSNVSETGEKTYCDTDADCWCRKFDGTRFIEGKDPSVCILETGKCRKCMYR